MNNPVITCVTSTMSIRLKWSRSCFHLLFCCLVFSLPCQGQVIQLARFEVPLGKVESEYHQVVSLKEKGLLLYRRLLSKEGVQMEIIRLDTALQPVWKGYISLEQNIQVQQATLYQHNLFILLRHSVNATGNFQVLAINSDDGEYKIYKINNLIPFIPKEFVVTQAAFLIGGYFNYRPLVLHYGLTSGDTRVLPGFLNEPGELMQVKAYETGSVDIVVGAKNLERQKCLWIRNYDADGNLNKTIVLEPGPKKNLLFGQSVKMPGNEQVVAGVYGRFTDYSRGVFVSYVDPNGEYQINYYNFGDLQNFFSYMKAKRVKRIKERIERRKIKGKKIKFNYRFLVHSLVPYHDKYILLGEAFYPTYKYSSYVTGLGFYTPYRNDMIFDGYQYTHAVVIGFTKNGKLLWDNSFEINDIKSFHLEQFVKIHPEENRIVLLYLFQNVIRSKIIDGDKVLEGKTDEELKTQSKDSLIEIENTELAKLEYWYNKNFYVWGVQNVKNLSPQKADPRKVFFITKVTYP